MGSTLEVYDGKTFEKIDRVRTDGRRCWHFTFTPDAKDILLACGRSANHGKHFPMFGMKNKPMLL